MDFDGSFLFRVASFIGGFLFAIPMVGGEKYVYSIIGYLKKIAMVIGGLAALTFIVPAILITFDLDFLIAGIISLFTDSGFFEEWESLLIFLAKAAGIGFILALALGLIAKALEWAEANEKSKSERLRRLGVVGLIFMGIGIFYMDIFTLLNHAKEYFISTS